MKLLFIFTFYSLINAQTLIRSKPVFLSGDFYNFYTNVDATILNDSLIAVFDIGNLNIQIINLHTKQSILRFGKGGQGPSELQKYMRIYSYHGLIYMVSNQRYLIFDITGRLIKKKKQSLNRASLFFDEDKNIIRMISIIDNEISLIDYTDQFEIKHIKSDLFGSGFASASSADFTQLYSQPFTYIPWTHGVIGSYKGKFKAFNITDEKNEMDIYSANVIRKKLADDFDMGIEGPKNNPEFKAMITKLNTYIINESNGYEDDILETLGVFSDFAVYRINDQLDDNLSYIFIDLKKRKEPQIINIPYIKSDNFIVFKSRFQNNTLIILCNDDYNGASILLYKMLMN